MAWTQDGDPRHRLSVSLRDGVGLLGRVASGLSTIALKLYLSYIHADGIAIGRRHSGDHDSRQWSEKRDLLILLLLIPHLCRCRRPVTVAPSLRPLPLRHRALNAARWLVVSVEVRLDLILPGGGNACAAGTSPDSLVTLAERGLDQKSDALRRKRGLLCPGAERNIAIASIFEDETSVSCNPQLLQLVLGAVPAAKCVSSINGFARAVGAARYKASRSTDARRQLTSALSTLSTVCPELGEKHSVD